MKKRLESELQYCDKLGKENFLLFLSNSFLNYYTDDIADNFIFGG